MSSDACVVVIGPAGTLPALTQKTAVLGEVLAFGDADARKALETIAQRKPAVFALERLFAATPRGAALINRVKADASLADTEIRVIAHDTDYSPVSPRKAAPPAQPLDQRGTRRAARFKMAPNVAAMLDDKPGTVIDLSSVGAQVISHGALKPNQRVEMTLTDETSDIRFNASVAWTSFETSALGGPTFRAGINFEDADPVAVDKFCARHRQQ